MIWLIMVVVVVVVLAVLVAVALDSGRSPRDVASYRAQVELHAVRRRFDVAQVKHEVRRDAAQARRELRDELDRLSERR